MVTGLKKKKKTTDKSSGKRKQKIDIYYKAIGIFNVPDEDESLLRDENGNFLKKQTA